MPRYVYSKTIEVMALELNKPGRLFRAKSPTQRRRMWIDAAKIIPYIKAKQFTSLIVIWIL
jgi:hypothetical protein